jgi:Fe/S biogenesis protein NfuA
MDTIEDVLDEKVRPLLALHDGVLSVSGFEDGILRVKLSGAGSGCPSADVVTEPLIYHELQTAIPELKEVILVNGVSDSLLGQARALMGLR